MVALFVVAIMLCALTADYVVQRLALRAPAYALDDIFLDASHLWISPEPTGVARIGADDVVAVLLGRPWRIEWSPTGQVKRGMPLAVVHGRRDPFLEVDNAELLYAAAAEPRRLAIVDELGHAFEVESVDPILAAVEWCLDPAASGNPTRREVDVP